MRSGAQAFCTWAFPFCVADDDGGDSRRGATLAKLVRRPTSSIPKAAESTRAADLQYTRSYKIKGLNPISRHPSDLVQ